MTAGTGTYQEVLRGIVRGERPLADLAAVGVSMRRDGASCSVPNPRRVEVTVDVHDLAQGLLAHRSDPAALRDWALFIYASDVDGEAEGHPAGETVLGALWDASFGNPIAPDVAALLEDLAEDIEDQA
jgi:hypothetical protein